MQTTLEQLKTDREKYLTLLRDTLCFALWPEPLKPIYCTANRGPTQRAAMWIDCKLRQHGLTLAIVPKSQPKEGVAWPVAAHTMVGLKRLNNIRQVCETVDADGVPGNWVECGVWRGGASIYARACINPERMVICCDSFQGLPFDPAEPELSTFNWLRVPASEVRANFEKFGLLHNVRFYEGWFSESLHFVPGPIAILRADGDMESSTMQILGALYNKVSLGGFVIIDDWNLGPCRKAAETFRAINRIADKVVPIDDNGVYWRKSAQQCPAPQDPPTSRFNDNCNRAMSDWIK